MLQARACALEISLGSGDSPVGAGRERRARGLNVAEVGERQANRREDVGTRHRYVALLGRVVRLVRVPEPVAPTAGEALDASEPVQDVGQRVLVALFVGPRAQLAQCGPCGGELVGPTEREGLEVAGARLDPAGGSARIQLAVRGLEGEGLRERFA